MLKFKCKSFGGWEITYNFATIILKTNFISIT